MIFTGGWSGQIDRTCGNFDTKFRGLAKVDDKTPVSDPHDSVLNRFIALQ